MTRDPTPDLTRVIRVLHVDDDPAFRDLAAELLERADGAITVRSEADPTAVPERLDAEPVDCVVSDYDMVEQDGLELCRTVRQSHPLLPFFLFTSRRSADLVERAIDTGVTDYITKESGTHHYTLLAKRIALAVTCHRALRRLDRGGQAPDDLSGGTVRADGSTSWAHR